MNQRLRVEDVDSPLVTVRPVKTVLVAVVTGDRGLCGGYNNFVIKKVRRNVVWWLNAAPFTCAGSSNECLTKNFLVVHFVYIF